MNTKQVFIYYKSLMGLLYIAMGLYIVSSNDGLAAIMGKNVAMVLGILVAAYGGFRFYRAWFVERNQHPNNDSSNPQ